MSLLGGLSINPQKTLSGGAGINMAAINGGGTIGQGGVLPNANGGDLLYYNLGSWTSVPNRSLNAPVAASYVVINPEAELTSERQLAVDTAQLRITDNGAGSTVSLSFPAAAPPQSGFTPTIGDHLTNKTYVDLQVGGSGALPAPGSAGNVLTSDGSVWTSSTSSSGPLTSFYTNVLASQAFTGAANDPILFDTVVFNKNTCVTVLSTSQFEIVNTGYYNIKYVTDLSKNIASPDNIISIYLIRNSTSDILKTTFPIFNDNTIGYNMNMILEWEGDLVAGDVIQLLVNDGDGWVTSNVDTGSGLFIRLVAPGGAVVTYTGVANEIDITGTNIGFPSQVVFSTNAPKCAIAPTTFDSLTNLDSVQNLILSMYGQSDQITTLLNATYPNTRHIWYNRDATASACSFWVNSGETIPAIEVTITTKSNMPQWPAYLWMDSGGGLDATLSDLGVFMLPQPGATKTYTRNFKQSISARTCAAGTFYSLWDGVTTNVLGAPTSVLSATGTGSTSWGLCWGMYVLTAAQLNEVYEPLSVGSINLITSPSSSNYFSAIQIRARY